MEKGFGPIEHLSEFVCAYGKKKVCVRVREDGQDQQQDCPQLKVNEVRAVSFFKAG